MPVTAIITSGVRLWYSSDGTTYTELVDLERIGEPMRKEAPDVPVMTLLQTSKEYLIGIADNGTIEFTQYWSAARHTALLALFGALKYWKVSYPDHATEGSKSKLVAQGRMNSLSVSAHDDPEKPITISCKVKISGDSTYTATS